MVFDLYSVFRQIVLNVKHGLFFIPVQNRQSSVLQHYLVKLSIPLMSSTGITNPQSEG